MLRFSTTRLVAILALTFAGFLYAAPNLFPVEWRRAVESSVPGWLPGWIIPHRGVVLGLDLQGGSHLLLEVDINDLIKTQIAALRDDVRRIVRETKVGQGGITTLPRGVQLRLLN